MVVFFYFCFTLKTLPTQHSYMAGGALAVRSESHVTIMASPAIFALIKRLHIKIFVFFCRTSCHFKKLIMTIITAKPCVFYVFFVVKNHRLHRFGKNNRFFGIFFFLLSPKGLIESKGKNN